MQEEVTARMRILEMIDGGKITADEGLRLLHAIQGAAEEAPLDALEYADQRTASVDLQIVEESPSEASIMGEALDAPPAMPAASSFDELSSPAAESSQQESPPEAGARSDVAQAPHPSLDVQKWRYWWTIPFWIAVGVAAAGAGFMYWAAQSAGPASFWFFCATLPFALGVMVAVLAFFSRTWPWLHLRVQQAPGETPQRIAISLPIPVRPLAWGMRILGNWVPEVREHDVAEIILAVGKNTSSESPLYIQADDEDGEKVEIYIG
jgi:hypothetical protein